MPSLTDLATGGLGDVVAYRKYVIACAEVGKTPLSMESWVKAGKPEH
jgi:hypothetical protein